MTDYQQLARENPQFYLMFGDLDKPFHRAECECPSCEEWRVSKGRPTHEELREKEQS